ncbi:MAG TPA: COX15/CtaA family protein [Acidimicrobiales bacterium]|nr:COX15/CtaA family protein [Acidimicrobiales bacterium]
MALPRLSPRAYRCITLGATLALATIIVTGAAVRLTGSGLGCTDWPTCEQGQLAPADMSHAPAMIEFVNRLFTGVVSVAVILAVLGSMLRRPRRGDLTWLSAGLVIGVVAQILLGAAVVLLELSPQLVMGHFLLSMVLLWNAVVLHHRAGRPEGQAVAVVEPLVLRLGRTLFAVAAVVIFTGTVVTATGPHAGDQLATRLGFHLPDVARVHGLSVVVMVVLTLSLVALLVRRGAPERVRVTGAVLVVLLLAQAGVGYAQWFAGVPALLVGVHIIGAIAVWTTVVRLNLVLSAVLSPTTGGRRLQEHPPDHRDHRDHRDDRDDETRRDQTLAAT